MHATLTDKFSAAVEALRADESAFDARLQEFADKAATEITAHERHRAALAKLNSSIGAARDALPSPHPLQPKTATSRTPLPPAPPMRFDTAEKVGNEFLATLTAALVCKKGN
jgi:hypothetical protein